MSNFLFHNKFHRANHHTIATPGLPDSATDPIASQSEPFLGIFYNYQNALLNLSSVDVSYLETFLTDFITTFDGLSVNTIQSIYAAITANVFTNSKQWFEMHTNINAFSAAYGLYPTVYSTVNTFSGIWNLGYNFYSSLNTLSTNYFSTYTVVNTYSANWPFIDTTLRLNLIQENTRSKNFSGARITDISVIGGNVSAYWNLSAAQCAFFRVTGDTVFKNIVNSNNKKKGGEYTLVLQQDGFGNRPVTFESDYVFSAISINLPKIYFYTTGIAPTPNNLTFNGVTGNWHISSEDLKASSGHIFALSSVPGPDTLWIAYGANTLGQLGLGDNTNRTTFVKLTGNWDKVVCGNLHSMALSGKTLHATGSNTYGQLGLNDNIDRNEFTPLTGEWDRVVCGAVHTFALSGGVWYATGNNADGQLGLGDFSNRNTFTPLTGNWDNIIPANTSTFAFSGGVLFETGLSYANYSPSFTPLTGNWDDIVWFNTGEFALSGNKWFGRGSNLYGTLGLGDNIDRNEFTPLTGEWDRVVCGAVHALALSGNKWYSVGYNFFGQLALGDTSNRNEFTEIPGTWNDVLGIYDTTFAFNSALENVIFTTTNVISPTALSVTVIRFTCDGNKLYGKPTFYYYERNTIWTYFAGEGLIFNPDPAEFYINDYFIPVQGLTVVGVVVPAQGYSDGGGIVVVEGLPS